jgi:hypothetical protein
MAEWLREGGGGDVTQHLVQTGRQDGFQMVGCFALGVTQFYKVIFFRVFKAKCQGFFPPEGNVTKRFAVYLYNTYDHGKGQLYSQYEMEFIMERHL